MDNVGNILSELPNGFFQHDDHLDNMQKFSTYVNAASAVTGGDPIKNNVPPISQDELRKFGNWTGQTDNKVMAQDLMNKGLEGANQLLFDTVNTKTGDTIRNAQSDWKISAIQNILSNAKRLNIRTPTEVNANRDVLIGNPKWAEGINSDSFKNIHPNFWSIVSEKILPEQYAKFDKNSKQTALK